jgi:hypothetical protein
MRCVLAHFGGNWNNGANAGLSNWNLNNTSSNTNVNIGRQTLVSKLNKISMHLIILTAWWKLGRKEQGLVGFSRNTLRLIRRRMI